MKLLQFRENLSNIFPTLKYNLTVFFPRDSRTTLYAEIELFARVAPFKSIKSRRTQFRKTLGTEWNCRNCHFTHLIHISTIMSIYPQLHMPALISLQCHAMPRYHAIIITRRLWLTVSGYVSCVADTQKRAARLVSDKCGNRQMRRMSFVTLLRYRGLP